MTKALLERRLRPFSWNALNCSINCREHVMHFCWNRYIKFRVLKYYYNTNTFLITINWQPCEAGCMEKLHPQNTQFISVNAEEKTISPFGFDSQSKLVCRGVCTRTCHSRFCQRVSTWPRGIWYIVQFHTRSMRAIGSQTRRSSSDLSIINHNIPSCWPTVCAPDGLVDIQQPHQLHFII